MIPPILHYVWVGGPLPPGPQAYLRSWRETNPHFEIQCWNEHNIDFSQSIIRDAYNRRQWAKVADIARLQAVLVHGGIYLDTDIQLIKPLDSFLHYRCFYGFQERAETEDWVCNAAFGAEPGHWFIKEALDQLYGMNRPWYQPERPTDYGPKHITRLLRNHGLRTYSEQGVSVRDIYLAPTPVFYPFHFTEEYSPECVMDETVAIHFWEKSWNKSVPVPFRMARHVRNHARRVVRTIGGRTAPTS